MKLLDATTEPSKTFEIVVGVRDSQGKLTGKRKSYSSDSAYKIYEFWSKYVGNTRAKHKGNALPTESEAKKILKQLYGDNQDGK
jgi:hypothetical protein